ncbi:MAG: putative metal-binding motif-containing protein [Deltaproteobacteria bacterium]|nr:putative metal-binding motif-containing protein [Deltaproteobacteria bacterium]
MERPAEPQDGQPRRYGARLPAVLQLDPDRRHDPRHAADDQGSRRAPVPGRPAGRHRPADPSLRGHLGLRQRRAGRRHLDRPQAPGRRRLNPRPPARTSGGLGGLSHAARPGLYALLPLALVACGAKSGLELPPDANGFPAIPESCNGLDDDGDGRIDEDIPPATCGAGACRNEVWCEDGVFPPCVPLPGSPETCNGLDDDCDGLVDEGLGFGPLGPPRELREGVGSGGSCTSCNWAWDTALAPAADGWLALWRVGISGGHEVPNLYGRPLSRTLEPTGPVRVLATDVVLDMHVVPSDVPAPDTLLESRLRVGRTDVAGWVRVSADGAVGVERRTFELHDDCRAALSGETVWTGERLVSVCWAADAIHVVSSRRDGTDARRNAYAVPGAYGGNVAAWGGYVGVRAFAVLDGGATRSVAFLLLDAAGERLAGPREVRVPYASWARLIGTAAGWLHWLPVHGPTLQLLLSREGDPLTEPAEFPDLRRLGDNPLEDFQSVDSPTGRVLSVWQSPSDEPDSDLHVEFLDERGTVVQSWHGAVGDGEELDAYLVDPHAVLDGDRVLLIWHGLAEDRGANSVFVRSFGCID